MNNNDKNPSRNGETLFSEAPASWNTRYVDPNGFECQLTLRAETGHELLERVNGAIAYLLNNDCVPYTYNRGGYKSKKGNSKPNQSPAQNTSGNGQSNAAWCPIHDCEMKHWEKDGRAWYSHKVDGDWCNGK